MSFKDQQGTWWKKHFVKTKAWKTYQAAKPYFPDQFEIVTYDILQWTDVVSNHNKYYALEFHTAFVGNKHFYRLYSHYGRTGDLQKNPKAGQREERHYKTREQAEAAYGFLLHEKTTKKGYRKVDMASANVGSPQLQDLHGSSLPDDSDTPDLHIASTLHPEVQQLVEYLYSEATSQLTATISANITSRGIETPMGVLSLSQVQQGEAIIDKIERQLTSGTLSQQAAQQLSSEFYTVIPHKLGRSKKDVFDSIINTTDRLEQKRELLQLMKDILRVGSEGGVLKSAAVDNKYKALKNEIKYLEGEEHHEIKTYVLESQVKSQDIEVVNVFAIKRQVEHESFVKGIGNRRILFHGSKISNWVGLLSRGMLMPRSVTSLGGKRTDYGLLGSGLYFGGNACTSAPYTTPGKKGTRFMLLHTVALGRVKELREITSDLHSAPSGYNSVLGVSRRHGQPSAFEDDEYVVYALNQQRQDYLVEFKLMSKDTGVPAIVETVKPSPKKKAPTPDFTTLPPTVSPYRGGKYSKKKSPKLKENIPVSTNSFGTSSPLFVLDEGITAKSPAISSTARPLFGGAKKEKKVKESVFTFSPPTTPIPTIPTPTTGDVAEKSDSFKALLLISLLFKEQRISATEKKTLKQLTIQGDKRINAAVHAFQIVRDFDDLAENFSCVCKMVDSYY